jgi:PIN domain nuclease of toxin-antitoxin system
VLDASAVLALLFDEPGAEILTAELLDDAVIGTVNLAEVQARLVRAGDDPEEAWADARGYVSEVHPFTAEQARVAGSLISTTRSSGLSLGDRACLALALDIGAAVYTADQVWGKLDVGLDVHVIR